jgi:hypothetical protein
MVKRTTIPPSKVKMRKAFGKEDLSLSQIAQWGQKQQPRSITGLIGYSDRPSPTRGV